MIRVFVSSVSRGLETQRQNVIADLQRAGYDVGAMERFGAQTQQPIEVCLREVRRADVLVLIIGPRYGSVLPQGVSYTEAEFREAQGNGTPVLAFRIADDASVTGEEASRLADFTISVGATATYDALSAGDSLERLSGRVLAALSSARNRGEVGHRFSLFQPYGRYFSSELDAGTALFNHEGPFLGRDEELQKLIGFLSGDEPVLLLTAAGGSGKSRLLLEGARAVAQMAGFPHVFFGDSSASWSTDDINLLPSERTVLVFDDAHRRPDLDRLIANARQFNKDVRCIVSCRPSAVGIVTPLLSQLLAGSGPVQLDLPALTRADAELLAKHYLGTHLAHLAGRLVDVADRNPLVIRVGAQCIANDPVIPEMLERKPEAFRRIVLDRLLNDPSLSASDAGARRRILEVLAAIGPVATEDSELITQLASLIGRADHDVRRLLASLERTQFLRRRGRQVRISPDVLADHILYKAAVDELGQPTGFVDSMVAAFRASLESILANAAELDWRSATASPGSEPVLRAIWRDLLSLLPSASNRVRAELVGQLKRAAIFAPTDVLNLLEWMVRNRDAPMDVMLGKWGLEDAPDRLIENLTEVLFLIATNSDFTDRCAAQLWTLGAYDERPLHPYLSDPRRRLGELLEYDRRSNWESSEGVQIKAIEFMTARLCDTSRVASAPWAVSALGNALQRTGEANEWNRRVLTLKEFSLAYAAPYLVDRRTTIVRCLRTVALESKLDEAAAALSEIGKLIQAPRGPFGRGLEAQEISAWQPEAEHAIALLAEVAGAAESDVVRYLARRELRSVHREHWPEIALAVERALNDAAPAVTEQLYDLLIGIPWQEQLEDWRSEETRLDALCKVAAQDFWRKYGSPKAVVDSLLRAVAAMRGTGRDREPQVERLVHALVLSGTADPQELLLELIKREAAWPFLRPALIAAHEREPSATESLLLNIAKSEFEAVRAAAMDAAQWMIGRAADVGLLFRLTTNLSQDPALVVRAACARVLRRLSKQMPSEAIDLLTQIDWSAELWLANEVLGALDATLGIDPDLLTDTAVDLLLSRIERLWTLDGRNYEVLQFLALASHKRPDQTVKSLIRRVNAVDDHEDRKGDDRWLPFPYNGRGLELPGVQQSDSHQQLVRLIRDASDGASPGQQFWLPVLFHAADPNLSAGRIVLREWAASGEPEKIAAAASLLRGFDHSMVFVEHELIAELLVAASRCGDDCLQDTRGELSSLAISGVYSSAPGEPAPRHLHDRSESERLANAYSENKAVREFYQWLRDRAEASIRMDTALGQEDDE